MGAAATKASHRTVMHPAVVPVLDCYGATLALSPSKTTLSWLPDTEEPVNP
jgi:hypothetical protein